MVSVAGRMPAWPPVVGCRPRTECRPVWWNDPDSKNGPRWANSGGRQTTSPVRGQSC
jgi:hypothetical protein